MGDSIGGALRAAAAATPELDAEVLLAHVLGWSRARVLVERRTALPEEARPSFAALVERRAAREPVAYLVGEREFWSLPLAVDARVLVPRPETEHVVEHALALLRERPRDRRVVIDVGTGSGAIALAIACERDAAAAVFAIDRSTAALAVARANRDRLSLSRRRSAPVHLLAADLLGPVASASIDVVVANPPYLTADELSAAEPELAFEPRDALLGGGSDGLETARRLLGAARRVLRAEGAIVVEIGAGQGAAAVEAAREAGYTAPFIARDLENRDRVLVARRGECTVRQGSAGGAV